MCQAVLVGPTTRPGQARPRRTDPLSRDGIVRTAVELLDAGGEAGLTTRALTERLATGPGAIYHRVGTKDELLAAATDSVVAAALDVEPTDDPRAAVHALALGLFDATDAHPWLSTQLATQISRSPGGPTTARLFEGLGRQVRALGLPERSWFTATSAVMHYVLGAAGLNAVAGVYGRTLDAGRTSFLDSAATAWEDLDPDEYSFTRAVAAQLRDHDDREEFLTGLDLLLVGITAVHLPGR
ncbi:TetR/AcrR family transcriptional regulator [Actinomycetospora atypica]|uniref:TetR/AcrR family transcriptional regulator n=1 Tax=Actinomycetospora atypica TaxID=1290095 RepID=A0ABV9YG77_9PSEU